MYLFFQPRFVLSIIISVGSIIKNSKRRNRLPACVSIAQTTGLVWGDSVYCILVHYLRQRICTTGQSVWPMNDDDKCCNNESIYTSFCFWWDWNNREKKEWNDLKMPHSHPFINVACINRHIDKRIRCHFSIVQSASSTNNWEREFIELCVVN